MRFSRQGNAYIEIDGGLNTEYSRLAIQPGQFYAGINHCLADPKGIERIKGFERFDGHEKPSDARFTLLKGTYTSDVTKGAVVIGSVSGASGIVLVDYDANSPGLVVYTTDSFSTGEDAGGISNIEEISRGFGAPSAGDTWDWNTAAGDEARKVIQEIPGNGRPTGAVKYNGKVFAFRGDTVAYSTPTGWQVLNLGQVIPFTNGTATGSDRPPKKGDIVSNGSASAEVVNIQIKEGTWGASNVAGWITIKNKTGTFNDGDSIAFTGGATATGGDEEQIARGGDGYLRGIVYNFSGEAGDLALWCTDGKNQAWKIDKDGNYIPIYTGFEDKGFPEQIQPHHKHLFLSYGSNWVHSGIGDPFAPWTLVSGADQWGMGDDIVGCAVTPNATMLSFGENSIDVIYGSSTADFTVKPYSSEYGAVKNSIQVTASPTYVGEAGISVIQTTQKWGDFEINNIDENISSIVDSIRDTITCSVVFRNKKEYRVYAEKTCIRMKFAGNRIRGFTKDNYPIPIRNISSTIRDGISSDEVFFTSDDGYVYQMDSGDSFDGENIVAFAFMAQYHGGSHRIRKRWYNTIFEVDAPGMTEFYIKHDFSLYHPYKYEAFQREVEAKPSGGVWNLSKWNKAIWADGRTDNYYKINAGGVSAGVGVMIYSNHRYPGYLIRSMTHRYSNRSQEYK